MGLNKDQLVLDTAALSESDNVGAYLRSSDGTLLTHTDVGGKKSLDVNVANAVDLSAATLAALENISATVSGTVEIGATSLAALENITVSATALDIRALAFATDKVDASGSTVEIGATSLAALENISAIVTATNLDIRDLVFATDKVDVSGSVVALDAPTLAALENITAVIGGGITAAFSAVAVDATVGGTDLVAVDLASRKKILIQNVSSKAIYVGNSGVTTASGIKVAAGASAEFDAGPAINLYAITASGSADIRIMEVA